MCIRDRNKDGEIAANGEQLGYVSRFVVSAADSSVVVTRDFKDRLEEAINEMCIRDSSNPAY